MRPRVLLIARETILGWVPSYRAAFAEVADVVTAGPAIDLEGMRRVFPALAYQPYVPNDIVADTVDVAEIMTHLPAGWQPDLVVQVQSPDVFLDNVARLAVPTAYISVDTWHDSEEYRAARGFDAVFAAQPYFLDSFRETGLPAAHWLPLAYDPALHFPVTGEATHDVAFVGTLKFVANQPRIRRLNRLREKFSVYIRQDVMGGAVCRAYARGKLAFNSSICADVNMRVFEVMAMGRPLLMNRDAEVNGLRELFEPGREFIPYDDEEDLIAQTRRYLDDDAARLAVADAARAAVAVAHTYRRRAETVLETMGVSAPKDGAVLRSGGRLVDWLPHAPGAVLDIGLGLERSRIALRHHGVTQCIGMSDQAALRETKARSYDGMRAWPDSTVDAGAFDTVLWTGPFAMTRDAGKTLDFAAHALRAGGTLVLRLAESELAAAGQPPDMQTWGAWFFEHGFHLLTLEMPGKDNPWCIAVARRYTRPASDVAAYTYERFPAPKEDPNLTLPPCDTDPL